MLYVAFNTVSFRFPDGSIYKAIQQAVKEALLRHKAAGKPIVSWKDGGDRLDSSRGYSDTGLKLQQIPNISFSFSCLIYFAFYQFSYVAE